MNIRCNNCFKEYNDVLDMCPYCGYIDGEPASVESCLSPGTEMQHRYVIGEILGHGGFFTIYKAWDKQQNSIVAIKEYYPIGLVDRKVGDANVNLVATNREREFVHGKIKFLEFAHNMAKFSTHPNIHNIYDCFEANNTAYIVMELLDGKTITRTLQSQNAPLPYAYCIRIAVEICNALQSLHKENILHRDISPDNIVLCSNGEIKLLGFDMALFSTDADSRMGIVLSPGFGPPEQYDSSNRQDPRTDIYALGATMYYALTGQKPDESTNRKINDTLKEPAEIEKSIPQHISTVIMRAMALEPKYRFANTEDFENALLGEKGVVSVATERRRRRIIRIVSITLSILIVVGIATFYALHFSQKNNTGPLEDSDSSLSSSFDVEVGNHTVVNADASIPVQPETTKIPRTIAYNGLDVIEEYTPTISFFDDGRCELVLNMAEWIQTIPASYELFEYSDGSRVIKCTISTINLGDAIERNLTEFILVETAENAWTFYGQLMGLTSSGAVYTASDESTLEIEAEIITPYSSLVGEYQSPIDAFDRLVIIENDDSHRIRFGVEWYRLAGMENVDARVYGNYVVFFYSKEGFYNTYGYLEFVDDETVKLVLTETRLPYLDPSTYLYEYISEEALIQQEIEWNTSILLLNSSSKGWFKQGYNDFGQVYFEEVFMFFYEDGTLKYWTGVDENTEVIYTPHTGTFRLENGIIYIDKYAYEIFVE